MILLAWIENIRRWKFLLAGGLLAAILAIAAGLLGTSSVPVYERLRIGVLPDQDRSILEGRYAPVVDYLSNKTGIPCELVIPENYGELVDLFISKKIQLAYFGGLTFVQAQARAAAIPLVSREKDFDFQSYYLVRADSSATTIADLKGLRFTFGSRLSTSGHLMPRYFMERAGFQPDRFFAEVSYSGEHDRTAYLIRDGKFDAGVANADIIAAMFNDGRLRAGDLRIIDRTRPYMDNVWAAQPDMPKRIRFGIVDAFLLLSADRPEDKAILQAMDAKAFLPALSTDFAQISQVAAELSLMDRE